jgi:hypothetical protein
MEVKTLDAYAALADTGFA